MSFMSSLSAIPWDDLVAVAIRTTGDGRSGEDVWWQFWGPAGVVEIPGSRVDGPAFDELRGRLPALDHDKVIRAMGSTRERVFRVWDREASPARPSHATLLDRFRAVVETLGGRAAPSAVVARGVLAGWEDPARRYHDVEHLGDCLRELDRATLGARDAAVAELALWYHDVVYLPGASDSEERSARRLETESRALGVAEPDVADAAAIVRATAHASSDAGAAPHAALTALVLDIDLSILGREPLRFMDYEYSVEEEHPSVPRRRFIIGRGRFLAALLARPRLFRTEPFHERYEARARSNVAALLASRRYRLYRWTRCLFRTAGPAPSSRTGSPSP